MRRPALYSPIAGARLKSPPVLAWRPVRKARFYNVQLYRRGHKVLSRWPIRSRMQLRSRWTYNGRVERLRAGAYSWIVWPAFGTTANPRYGKMLGISSFRIVSQ